MELQNGTETENKKKTEKKWTWAEWALLIGVVGMFFGPMLLTGSWGWIEFDDSTGVIGDTIGGITAPISGILGAYLVYRALKAQIRANEIITEQFREQMKVLEDQNTEAIYIKKIEFIRSEIESFRVGDKEGLDAFDLLLRTERNYRISKAEPNPEQERRFAALEKIIGLLYIIRSEVRTLPLPMRLKLLDMIEFVIILKFEPVFSHPGDFMPEKLTKSYNFLKKGFDNERS